MNGYEIHLTIMVQKVSHIKERINGAELEPKLLKQIPLPSPKTSPTDRPTNRNTKDTRFSNLTIYSPNGVQRIESMEIGVLFLVTDTRLYTLPCWSIRNIFKIASGLCINAPAQLPATVLPSIRPCFHSWICSLVFLSFFSGITGCCKGCMYGFVILHRNFCPILGLFFLFQRVQILNWGSV